MRGVPVQKCPGCMLSSLLDRFALLAVCHTGRSQARRELAARKLALHSGFRPKSYAISPHQSNLLLSTTVTLPAKAFLAASYTPRKTAPPSEIHITLGTTPANNALGPSSR